MSIEPGRVPPSTSGTPGLSGNDPAPAGSARASSSPSPAVPGLRPAVPRNGTVAWALGFLAYLPIPIVGMIVAGVTQVIVGLGQRKHGGLAAKNGVRAANWGLTQLCWPVLIVATTAIGIATGSPSASGDGVLFHPVMNVIIIVVFSLFFLIALLEAIYAIVGTVQASRGREVRVPVIPFVRTPQE